MRKKIRKAVVVLNNRKKGSKRTYQRLRQILESHEVEVLWIKDHPTERKLALHYGDLKVGDADMVLAVGGDGTLLHAVRRTFGSGLPILGINAGSLGFLTSLPLEDLSDFLPEILDGHFAVSERKGLEVEVWRKDQMVCKGWALNEAVFNRGNHAHMVKVQVSISNSLLGSYLCDGLIVATPTGSTAYSLSAGGPILSPNSGTLLITPICAHTLSNRPVVISGRDRIQIHVPKGSPPLYLETDGLTCMRLRPDDRIDIIEAKEPVRIVHSKGAGFYFVLRQKLGWSGASISLT